MANHFGILALRTPWTIMKKQKYKTLKDESPRSVDIQYVTGEEQRNSSKGMKRLSQNGNDTQLWMCLVVKVYSDAVMNNVVLASAIQQSESAICIHIYPHFGTSLPLSHPSRSPQSPELSSLGYIAGSPLLSVLQMAVHICQSQSPSSFSFPHSMFTYPFYMLVSLFLPCK